ncbi:hypothetical protein C8F04DRAFT_1246878 [Mycena alexandri]|uniref:Uncharacterized protein n=1 Tax=Mycena alexandri TaxID=1745969 RepID=A0AAD6RV74_9AGAR|nr:hypothetical protein C8F04DRAFT_1246878 [Mycena alexandri]
MSLYSILVRRCRRFVAECLHTPTACSWASFASLRPNQQCPATFEPGVAADSPGRTDTTNLSQHALGHRSWTYDLPNNALLRLSPALPPIPRGGPPQLEVGLTSCSWASFAGVRPTQRCPAAFEPGVAADSSGWAATAGGSLTSCSWASFAGVRPAQRCPAAFEPGVAADSSGWAATAGDLTSCSWASFASLVPTQRFPAAFEPGVAADSSGWAATAGGLTSCSWASFASLGPTQRCPAAFEPGVAADWPGRAATAQIKLLTLFLRITSCSWAFFASLGPTQQRPAAFEPGVAADWQGRAATAQLSQRALVHLRLAYDLPDDATLHLSPASPPIHRGGPPQHNAQSVLLSILLLLLNPASPPIHRGGPPQLELSQRVLVHHSRVYELLNDDILRLSSVLPPIGRGSLTQQMLPHRALGHRSQAYSLPNNAMLRLSPASLPIHCGAPTQPEAAVFLVPSPNNYRSFIPHAEISASSSESPASGLKKMTRGGMY